MQPYMNVKSAKVGSEFLLLLWTDILEVLITEDHDSALCDEQGQLILLDVRELRQL